MNRPWCKTHEQLIAEHLEGRGLVLFARLWAEFSQHPEVQKALYHDPFVSELHQQARFAGVVAACPCVCCFLGPEAVEKIISESFAPQSYPVKERAIV